MCVSWSPDGKYLLTGSRDNTARLWDAQTGKQLHTLEGHSSDVMSVCWSPTGKFLATGSYDGTTRIWDSGTKQECVALLSLDEDREWLAVTPDGYFDGSSGASGFVEYRIKGTLDLVPREKYRNLFERPGLLGMILAGKDYRRMPMPR
jgi:WD40 repeat protein